ncbi:hypothetical protein FGB62_382g09 [Gracilaria domingensis]|nr:hypothetical protein FGB62_382g09 [Gracilaria domingensis]
MYREYARSNPVYLIQMGTTAMERSESTSRASVHDQNQQPKQTSRMGINTRRVKRPSDAEQSSERGSALNPTGGEPRQTQLPPADEDEILPAPTQPRRGGSSSSVIGRDTSGRNIAATGNRPRVVRTGFRSVPFNTPRDPSSAPVQSEEQGRNIGSGTPFGRAGRAAGRAAGAFKNFLVTRLSSSTSEDRALQPTGSDDAALQEELGAAAAGGPLRGDESLEESRLAVVMNTAAASVGSPQRSGAPRLVIGSSATMPVGSVGTQPQAQATLSAASGSQAFPPSTTQGVEVSEEANEVGGEEDMDDDVLEVLDDEELVSKEVITAAADSLGIRKFKDGELKTMFATIDILSLVVEPPSTLRGLSEEHISRLITSFKAQGVQEALGFLTVTFSPEIDGSLPANRMNGNTITCRCWLIDGRHRFVALKRLAAESEEWKNALRNFRVSLKYLENDRPLTLLDVLGIGGQMNRGSESVLAMSTMDYLHACVSHLSIIEASGRITLDEITPTPLAGVLISTGALGKMKGRQIMRYATIAIPMAKHSEVSRMVVNAFEECPLLGVMHLSSARIWAMPFEGIRLAIKCIIRRLEASRRGVARLNLGGFETMRASFYDSVKMLYSQVERTAKRHKLSTANLLARNLSSLARK